MNGLPSFLNIQKRPLRKLWGNNINNIANPPTTVGGKQGLYSCSVYLPYQPEKKGDAWKGIFVEGIDIRVWVKKQVPGCSVEYVLEPMDGVTGGYFVLEISWSC